MVNEELADDAPLILVVDDDVDIQHIARLALSRMGGFRVEVCSSGLDALERASAIRPDLVLMDVMMPELDGPTTLSRLKAQRNTASVPVAFMTARVSTQDRQRYDSLPICGLVEKPFDPLRLSGEVSRLLREVAPPTHGRAHA